MKTKYIIHLLGLTVFLLSTVSCKKFLETKAIQTQSVPESLNDLQLLLDNPIMQSGLNAVNSSSDEYYVTYTNWLSLTDVINKREYVWDAEVINLSDWNSAYKNILFANTVLFYLDQVSGTGTAELARNIKGHALFVRAYFFYLMAQSTAPQYDPATASTDLGIVLRLDPDFNKETVRSTARQSYEQMINDLESALNLLPDVQLYKTRPGKAACLALLAKVYLQMGDFEKSRGYADASLKITSNLIDFNSLTTTAAYPLGNFNNNIELLYYSKASLQVPLNGDETRARVDSVLYRTFADDDLRKKAFFRDNGNKTFTFKGSYTGDRTLFNGIAVDEIYLIRAECNARLNNANAAMGDLNTLLGKRWVSGKFNPYANLSAEQVLPIILQERRKELLYRGTRWSDLKRLNKDSRFAVTLKRELNGEVYLLPPNDLRYSALLPVELLSLTNLQQNPR